MKSRWLPTRREPDVPLQLLPALFGIVPKPKDNHLAGTAHLRVQRLLRNIAKVLALSGRYVLERNLGDTPAYPSVAPQAACCQLADVIDVSTGRAPRDRGVIPQLPLVL